MTEELEEEWFKAFWATLTEDQKIEYLNQLEDSQKEDD